SGKRSRASRARTRRSAWSTRAPDHRDSLHTCLSVPSVTPQEIYFHGVAAVRHLSSMRSKSTNDRKVGAADRLVALAYSSNPAVAALFETPQPGVHLARDAVQVIAGRGFAGDHPEKSFWRGAY